MQTNSQSSKENTLDFFEKINYLKWTDLKKVLQCLDKEDMVRHIEENISYTEGKLNLLNFPIRKFKWKIT